MNPGFNRHFTSAIYTKKIETIIRHCLNNGFRLVRILNKLSTVLGTVARWFQNIRETTCIECVYLYTCGDDDSLYWHGHACSGHYTSKPNHCQVNIA